MRPSRSIPFALAALAALVVSGTVAAPAHARRPRAFAPAPPPPVGQPLVSLSLEQPGGAPLPGFFHGGSLYYAGQQGGYYALRLTNNTPGRVEVVVTVDGRDVISGEVGNFKKQRGYVLDPFATVVVDGFRQSLDQVAAFQFSSLEGSYTARMGTPQNAGVIGVAVFEERRRSARRHRKQALRATPPPPVYEPYYRGAADDSVPTAFPDSPSAEAEAADEAPRSADRSVGRSADGGFAPVVTSEPASRKLGTAYGDSRYSAVEEVAFKRRRKRKPDGFLTVYYDSMDGLRARGVDVYAAGPRPQPQPPMVQRGFAVPPPGRR
ncbi:MAG: hypothetical protein AB1Z98_26710 [Nannocystaceae bacterium]